MAEWLGLFGSACLVHNLALSHFLGLEGALGRRSQARSALTFGLVQTAALVGASLVGWLLSHSLLRLSPYLRLVAYVFVFACVVQLVESRSSRRSPPEGSAVRGAWSLGVGSSAVLGLALLQSERGLGLGATVVHALGAGLGLTLASWLMGTLRSLTWAAGPPDTALDLARDFALAGVLSWGLIAAAEWLVGLARAAQLAV